MERLTRDEVARPPGCLSPAAIERLAAGESGDDPEVRSALAHTGTCPACAAALAEAVETRRFLGEVGTLLRDEPRDELREGPLRPSVDHRGPSPDEEPAPSTSILHGYRLVEVLGQGGQGTVWRAVHEPSGRRAAVKIVRFASPRERARMQREARLAAGLRHPGIVSILDCGALPDAGFAIAMELVEGPALDAWRRDLDAGGGPARERQRRTVRVMARVCAALHHAHQHGVIHRDLKPSNIVVCADDQPRLLDFGLARAIEPGSGQTVTRTGEFAGTVAYSAPEQVGGDGPVGTPADIWSVGVVLRELVVGELPFPTDAPIDELLGAIRRGQVTVPLRSRRGEAIDRDLATVILKATAAEPARRYESAAALRGDLERWLTGLPVEARRPGAWEVLLRTARRHWLAAAGIASAIATLAIFSVVVSVLYLKADEAQRRFQKLFEAASESTARATDVHRQADRSLKEISALYLEESRARRATVTELKRLSDRLGWTRRAWARELIAAGRLKEARLLAWSDALSAIDAPRSPGSPSSPGVPSAPGATTDPRSPRIAAALELLRDLYAAEAAAIGRPVDDLIAADVDEWLERLSLESPEPVDGRVLREMLGGGS